MKIQKAPAPQVVESRRRIIERPRLTRMLDESGARIILLVAPAGYGKTTLARQWSRHIEGQTYWYRGTPSAADIAALAGGVAAALRPLAPDAGERMLARLHATSRPEDDAAVFAEMLAEDVRPWPLDSWLVIDDYHFAMEAAAPERFIAALGEQGIPMLIASRRRPQWATARLRLYGDLIEVDRTALAMADEEARAVLNTPGDPTPLLREARGWPAVIGLAALTASAKPRSSLPGTLYGYFADELFGYATPGTRQALMILAHVPTLTADAARHVVGKATADAALAEGAAIGFVLNQDGDVEIHPLLGDFLRQKARESEDREIRGAIESVGRYLVDAHLWDDAFMFADETNSTKLLAEVVETALDDLLLDGRLPTIRKWLDRAYERQLYSPGMDLAEAELSFREGTHEKTELLAVTAAESLPAADAAHANAFVLAGLGAYFAGNLARALEYYRRAENATRAQPTRRRAVWGQFLAYLELEDPHADEAFSRLRELGVASPEDALRLATGHYQLALRNGRSGLQALLASLPQLSRSRDPLARSSFLNLTVGALVLAARYEDADHLAAQLVSEAQRYRLAFALPHAWLRRGTAALGLRDFERCDRCLDSAEEAAIAVSDPRLRNSVYVTRAILRLAERRPEDAHAVLDRAVIDESAGSSLAEIRAARALVLACLGQNESAQREATSVTLAQAIEARMFSQFAIAICEIRSGAQTSSAALREALNNAFKTDTVDCFVAAYRGFPGLLKSVDPTDRERVTSVLRRARDNEIGRQVGLMAPSTNSRFQSLSPREAEVFDLLCEGLTNRAIAQRLFVTESTVKVHVRHIFEKLDVRTRSAAVALRRKIESPTG